MNCERGAGGGTASASMRRERAGGAGAGCGGRPASLTTTLPFYPLPLVSGIGVDHVNGGGGGENGLVVACSACLFTNCLVLGLGTFCFHFARAKHSQRQLLPGGEELFTALGRLDSSISQG